MANGIRRSRGSQREGEGNLQEGGGETQEVSESSRGSSTEGRDGELKQRSRGTVVRFYKLSRLQGRRIWINRRARRFSQRIHGNLPE